LLLSWRDDVSSETAGPVIDLDTAVAAIRNAPRPPAKRQLFGSLAAAAAVMIIAFTGIGLAARDAVPGNPLFGVTKVLYSDKAKSVEAAVAVRTQLDAASEALASGRVDEAQAAIAQAQQKLRGVAAEDGQGALVAQAEQLMAQLQQQQLTPALPAPTSDVPSPLLPLETTPAPTPQPTVDTTTPEPVTTTIPTTPPPPVSTTDGSETTAPSATAEGPSSLGASSVQQAPGGKSGESLSEEPVSGTSSQGSGP